MLIEYIGHACFYITSNGVRIMTDPYDPSIGLAEVSRPTDILLISHDHYDHSHKSAAMGDYTLIDTPGAHTADGVNIYGYPLFHDDEGGSKRGTVTAFVIAADGIKLLHMGDVGAMPNDEFFEQIGHIDVLLIPVGGTYTVDAQGAALIMERINANITIPMHYKTNKLKLDIARVAPFIDAVKNHYDISRLHTNKYEIDKANLKKRSRVIVMENAFEAQE